MTPEDHPESAAAAARAEAPSPQAAVAGPQAAGSQAEMGGPQAEVAGPQAAAGVTHATAPGGFAVLDAAQRALLRAVLNRIVPARGDLPGAGDLEVGAVVERQMAGSVRLRRLFLEGLTEIGVAAQRASGADFVALDAAPQTAVLQTVEELRPAFFVALVEHTYRGYYTLRVVQTAVGFDARPPQPLGHQLPPFDPALLDRQRQRAPFWRAAD